MEDFPVVTHPSTTLVQARLTVRFCGYEAHAACNAMNVFGKTSTLPGKVSTLPEKMSALPGKVSTLPGKPGPLPGKVSTLFDKPATVHRLRANPMT